MTFEVFVAVKITIVIFWIMTPCQFPTRECFLFPFSVFRNISTFSSKLRTLVLFVTVAILSLYQSPDNCRSRKVKNNFMHIVGYHYYFQGLDFIQLPQMRNDLSLQWQ